MQIRAGAAVFSMLRLYGRPSGLPPHCDKQACAKAIVHTNRHGSRQMSDDHGGMMINTTGPAMRNPQCRPVDQSTLDSL
jgi:hypothetical protein